MNKIMKKYIIIILLSSLNSNNYTLQAVQKAFARISNTLYTLKASAFGQGAPASLIYTSQFNYSDKIVNDIFLDKNYIENINKDQISEIAKNTLNTSIFEKSINKNVNEFLEKYDESGFYKEIQKLKFEYEDVNMQLKNNFNNIIRCIKNNDISNLKNMVFNLKSYQDYSENLEDQIRNAKNDIALGIKDEEYQEKYSINNPKIKSIFNVNILKEILIKINDIALNDEIKRNNLAKLINKNNIESEIKIENTKVENIPSEQEIEINNIENSIEKTENNESSKIETTKKIENTKVENIPSEQEVEINNIENSIKNLNNINLFKNIDKITKDINEYTNKINFKEDPNKNYLYRTYELDKFNPLLKIIVEFIDKIKEKENIMIPDIKKLVQNKTKMILDVDINENIIDKYLLNNNFDDIKEEFNKLFISKDNVLYAIFLKEIILKEIIREIQNDIFRKKFIYKLLDTNQTVTRIISSKVLNDDIYDKIINKIDEKIKLLLEQYYINNNINKITGDYILYKNNQSSHIGFIASDKHDIDLKSYQKEFNIKNVSDLYSKLLGLKNLVESLRFKIKPSISEEKRIEIKETLIK